MNELSCKSCGGTLEFEEGQSVAVCDSCGKKQTLPRFHSDKKKNLFARAGQLCRAGKFDKALNCYEDALKEDAEDPEVHWMMAMCRYGVEYVEDADGKRKPTIHRIQDRSVLVDPDYKEALQYADDEQKTVYEAEAREIDRIQKAFLDIARHEKPFDVFICYKETGADGKRTQDSVLANELYHSLTTEGFKVFYAAITLEDKLGVDYEPYIFAALQSARVMVVLGTKKEYFEATWVRNEWNRYLALIEDEKEKNGISKRTLIPAYRDMDAYDLPEEFAHLQAMDMSKLGFIQDLIRGIKKLLYAGQEKQAAPQQVQAPAAGKTNLSNLETRMFNFCQDGDWRRAEEYAERVLDNDPNNGKAYLGHLLVEAKCHNVNELQMSTKLLPEYRYFANAMEKGDAQQKKMLQELTISVTKRMEQEKNDAAYANAMRALQKANETKEERTAVDAMHIFRELNGWRDSEKKAKESEELVDAIRAEKKRIADETKAAEKRRRTRSLIIKLVIAAAIVIFIWYHAVGKKDMAYRKAVKLIKNEAYDDAYEILSGLKGYKGADTLIVKNRCERANALIDNGDMDRAKDLVIPVIDTPEAQNVMCRINYEYGKAALGRDEYDEAYTYLLASNSYGDADELIRSSKYDRAAAAEANGEIGAAYELFNQLGDYKDTLDHMSAIGPVYGEQAVANEDFLTAYRVYNQIGDTEQAAALEEAYPWVTIPDAQVGDSVWFGHYEQDADKSNGTELVEWIVLGRLDDKVMLLAKDNIDLQQFNEEGEPTNWEECSLRSWMNENMFADLFAPYEAKRVLLSPVLSATTVETDSNGGDTEDHLFLLSYDEAAKYLEEGLLPDPEVTAYSESLIRGDHKESEYWLRTMADTGYAYRIGDSQFWYQTESDYYIGVRPALWFDLTVLEEPEAAEETEEAEEAQ